MSWILTHCFQDSFLCFYFFKHQIVDSQAPKPWAHPCHSFFTGSLYKSVFTLSAPRNIIVSVRGGWCLVIFLLLFSCSIPPIPHCLSLTWRSFWGYFCEHLEFSASLLALFDASEKVHFTPEPSCIASSLDLTLDHASIMQSKYHLFETVNYKSWTSGAVFSIRRLSRL